MLLPLLAGPAWAQIPLPAATPAAPAHHAKPKHHAVKVKAVPAKIPVVRPHHPGPVRHAVTPPVVAAPAPVPKPLPPAPAAPDKGSVTGLPIPRYAALKTDDVNLRAGPGLRYRIDWVYKRRDLPVEIEREFDVWRLVEDMDGIKGWVHQATLAGHRSFVITGTDNRTLRELGDDGGPPVAVLRPGVIGRIRSCDAGAAWCQVQVGDYRGWLRRSDFWGTAAGEAVQP